MNKKRTDKSVQEATALLAGSFPELVAEEFALRDKDGNKIEFDLKPGESVYAYSVDARGWMHCYTPHRDTTGRFWCWSYKPIGKGSQSGTATDFKLMRPRCFAVRYKAKRLAQKRTEKGNRQLL
jgi:hypothetical protein